MAALKEGLQKVVTVLRNLNVKLKTLEILYAGMCNGKVKLLLNKTFVAMPGYKKKPADLRARIPSRCLDIHLRLKCKPLKERSKR